MKEQLAESKSQGAQVQSRLESFEGKLEWLTNIMVNQQQAPSTSNPSFSPLSVSPLDLQTSSPPSALQLTFDPSPVVAGPPAGPSGPFLGNVDSLVAREHSGPLPRIPTSPSKKSILLARSMPSNNNSLISPNLQKNLHSNRRSLSVSQTLRRRLRTRQRQTSGFPTSSLGMSRQERRKRCLVMRICIEK